MLSQPLCALVVLFACLAPIPTSGKPTTPAPKPRSFVDKFDDVVAVLAAVQPVKATAGGALYYRAYNYGTAARFLETAPSSPNGITTGPVGMTTQGQPAWYPMNSSIPYFDQKSNAEAAAVPTTCTIQFTGVRLDGTTVVQELPYNPKLLGNTLNFTTFPESFSGLKSMSQQIIQGAVPTTLIAPLYDNNAYTAYFTK